MTTLPPTPTYNANIPIISSAGGTAAAYKDPNSPESIMEQTTLLHAQSIVDTTYDVDLNAEKKKEGFSKYSGDAYTSAMFILYSFLFLLLLALFTRRTPSAKIYLLSLASLLLILTIFYI